VGYLRLARIATLSMLTVAIGAATAFSQAAPAAPASAPQAQTAGAPAEQTAVQKYKNVQVLKDMPVPQFDDVMVYMNAATGQNCEGCHVKAADGTWQHDKDDKDHKKTARTMLTMVRSINAQHFKGEPTVTCATCHQGRREPNAATPVAVMLTPDQIAMAAARAQMTGRPQPPSETADQLIDKYIAALGGRDAVKAVNSRVMKGTVTTRASQTVPLVVQETAAGAYRSTAQATPAMAITQAYDGTSGWVQSGTELRAFTGIENAAIARYVELGYALAIRDRLSRLAVGRYEKLDGQDVVSLNGRSEGGVLETLYFDRATGLLARRIVRLPTAMGPIAVQLDFGDYRAVQGVQTPHMIRITTWDGVNTAKFTEVTFNGAVDAAQFRKPSAPGL
jgi:hypothetical protein